MKHVLYLKILCITVSQIFLFSTLLYISNSVPLLRAVGSGWERPPQNQDSSGPILVPEFPGGETNSARGTTEKCILQLCLLTVLMFIFHPALRQSRMLILPPHAKCLQENTGIGMLLGFTPARDCDFDTLIFLTRIYFVISKRLHCTCSLSRGEFSSLYFLWQKRPWNLTNYLVPLHTPCPQPQPLGLLKK